MIGCPIKYGRNLLFHSQTSMVALLKFGNGLMVSSHTLRKYLYMLVLSLNHVSKNGPRRPPECKDGVVIPWSWWRHQMGIFSALLALCVGNSPVNGEFPAQRPVTGSFDVFFDLRLNKRLSKQSWGWWFEKPSRSLWPQSNGWNEPSRILISFYHHSWVSFSYRKKFYIELTTKI